MSEIGFGRQHYDSNLGAGGELSEYMGTGPTHRHAQCCLGGQSRGTKIC